MVSKSFKKYLLEMPVANMHHLGDWEKNHSFRDRDRKILKHPKHAEIVKKKFENSNADFNLFFVNSAKANKHTEVGEVDIQFVKNELGDDVYQAVEKSRTSDEDAINIIFTNNKGAQRVSMTPWIIAHRLGHALARERGSRDAYVYKQASDFLIQAMGEILEYYGKQDFPDNERRIFTDRKSQLAMKAFFTKICTFKSARENKIRDWFEVLNELIAQYITTGKIKFNEPPRAFGSRYSGYYYARKEELEDLDQRVDMLSRDMEMMIDDILSSSAGKIFVM